ncbi:hypothetical protein C0J52_18689 [Blattella germanica]|nr:hypothetical protein C0J52_18689 [Blattella germanica]
MDGLTLPIISLAVELSIREVLIVFNRCQIVVENKTKAAVMYLTFLWTLLLNVKSIHKLEDNGEMGSLFIHPGNWLLYRYGVENHSREY